jgi:GxxExxY protein
MKSNIVSDEHIVDILCHSPCPRYPPVYRRQRLEQVYKPDFICFGKIIVEIKAHSSLIDEHRAQVINYLHATGFQLGLLINFGSHPKLQWERLVVTKT